MGKEKEDLYPLMLTLMKKFTMFIPYNCGGESGIRTHGTFDSTQAFQAGANFKKQTYQHLFKLITGKITFGSDQGTIRLFFWFRSEFIFSGHWFL